MPNRKGWVLSCGLNVSTEEAVLIWWGSSSHKQGPGPPPSRCDQQYLVRGPEWPWWGTLEQVGESQSIKSFLNKLFSFKMNSKTHREPLEGGKYRGDMPRASGASQQPHSSVLHILQLWQERPTDSIVQWVAEVHSSSNTSLEYFLTVFTW